MSGTPVITSDRGAMPEVVSPEVGFVCSTMDEYVRAVENIGSISPEACRRKAMAEYHYLVMGERYVREYERAIEIWSAGVSPAG
jgi:glycosyltransferase involved in cell wall biosynthesis